MISCNSVNMARSVNSSVGASSKSTPDRRRRGRPSKFGRPSRVVAVTLPEDVISKLHRLHRDLGWAIVKLIDSQASPRSKPYQETEPDLEPDVELVTVADRRALIAVNREVIRNLPGVNIIPLSGTRAFLALDIDRGLSDLELAVNDTLVSSTLGRRERQGLVTLQAQLRTWRKDQGLRFHTRAIIVVERLARKTPAREKQAGARATASRRIAAGQARSLASKSPFDSVVPA
jgi:hypothetical protein